MVEGKATYRTAAVACAAMAHPRKFRFGIQLHTATGRRAGPPWPARPRTSATRPLFMPDHFGDQLAPVPALMAAADATTTLKVGALVFDNDYKHPVVLAKEIATLDVLSGGRVEFGIGAGWMKTDYEQSGIPKDRAGVRVDRMEEGIAVLKGALRRRRRTTSPATTTRSPATTACPSRSSGPTRRSSSAAAASGCCRSPPARPTSSASTPSIRQRRGRRRRRPARQSPSETDQKLAVGQGRRRRPLRRPRDQLLAFACIVTDDSKGTNEMMAPLFGAAARGGRRPTPTS